MKIVFEGEELQVIIKKYLENIGMSCENLVVHFTENGIVADIKKESFK